MNPVDIGLRIAQALDSIGIKMGSYIGKSSNVKKAMFGGKPTMFKPNALEALRGTNANFDDALKLIENEAQFIVNATDAEKMAFLNNVNDYKQFGGPLKQDVVARTDVEQGLGSLKGDIEDLQSSTSDLLTTAKSMKADAEKGLKSAEDDLATFFETGGNPLNKKDKKFLGGSMHEEGQIRTGIREFLKKEFKNGRINLDETDAQRILQYSPMSEDDPILVFKKIYGDEAYKKAGSFPGAFDVGESYNHYESIFRSKMGEDILKVKDKKYVGDGKLVLTESEEVFTPSKFDDDIPYAEGGIADVRPGFVKGKGVTKVKQIIEYITSKFTPMDAMKEVNKVIGKQGKYKNLKLTQKDIDEIVENTEDFIFQRDPDNKFVEGSIKEKTEYLDEDDVLERDLFAPKSDTQVFKDSEGGIKGITMGGDDKFKKAMSEAMEEGIRESENMKRLGLDPSKMEDALKYDKMKEDGQLEKNVTGLADMSESETLMKKYPGMNKKMADQIANDTDPNRKANIIAMVEQTFKLSEKGKSGDEIIQIFKDSSRTEQADGGITRLRNGYYGGGQAMVEPDLSDIGHGSDALMARTRITAPGSQATTSTGLNYLLGEDNDNIRVPFENGLLVPPKKPVPPANPFNELMRIYKTYEEAMPGVSKDTKVFLQNDFKEKLDNAKISVEEFMTYRMQKSFADGGRIGFEDGLNFDKAFEKMLEKETEEYKPVDISAEGKKILTEKLNAFMPNETEEEKKEKEMFKMVKEFQKFKKDNPDSRMSLFMFRDKKKKEKTLLKNKILELDLKYPDKEIIDKETNMVNKENLKSAIDQAEADLEISPIDGLTLKRSINTEGEQSVTSGNFDLGNLNFSSDNIEEGKLTSTGNFNFGGIDLSGMVDSNDGQILNTELGFNYDNALKGKMTNSDGYRSTELDLNKTFPINDKFNLNLKGGADTQTFDGKTYKSSNLTPKLSYNDGIFNADISKEILKGGDELNLGAGVKFNDFYAKGDNLLSEDRSGVLGYQKEFGDKDGNLFFTAGAEKNLFNDEYTGGLGLKYKYADGGIAGLRQGYVGGGGVNLARRGFLKLAGATVASVAALKSGLVKILGKGAATTVPKMVTIPAGSGAPAWFEGMVNKVLADGIDITKKAATLDGQVVKSLDTPTGKVDVTFDTRTGSIDAFYKGENTAMGESVDMRYTVNQADEGTKGVKPMDDFEAVETIPEGQMYFT